MKGLRIKPTEADDIPAVMAIQKASYSCGYQEGQAVSLSILREFPQGCNFAFFDGKPAGYIFAHPWLKGEPRPLFLSQWSLPASPDCFYIHDVAVHPDMRSKGIAAALLEFSEGIARSLGLNTICLTAVQDSHTHWGKYKFETCRRLEYGGMVSYYMQKKL